MSLTFNEPRSAGATQDFASTDFCDPKTYDDPWELYAWLRDLDHLHFDEKNELYIAPRHEDVFHVSRETDYYVSSNGVRPAVAGDMSIITLDGAEHLHQRRLISQGFTPRPRACPGAAHARKPPTRSSTRSRTVARSTSCRTAMRVPLIIICELMGLDPDKREAMYRWSDDMMAGDSHVEEDDPVLRGCASLRGVRHHVRGADRRTQGEGRGSQAEGREPPMT